jgi:GT2 family glycosyltransferase
VIGAFFLVRRSIYDQLQGFDERFFVYFEEVDFCERTRQLGMQIVYLATAQARHVGGGCSNQVKATSLFYSLRSRLLYARKHFSNTAASLVEVTTLFAEPTIRIFRAAISFRWKKVRPLADAFGMLWRDRFARKATAQAAVPTTAGERRAA